MTDTIELPSDTLGSAVYNSVKLDFLLGSEGTDISQSGKLEARPTEARESSINRESSVNPESSVNRESSPSTQQPLSGHSGSLNQLSNQQVASENTCTPSGWTPIRYIGGAHSGWIRAITVDPVTNKFFATGGADADIKIWDLASSELKASLTGHVMGIRSLLVSPRHPYLFSASEDKTLRCWDLERTHSTAGCEVRKYHGHVGGVYSVALHPELDLLVSAGRDAAVRLWDMRSRTEIMTLVGHTSDVSSVYAQTANPQVVSASMDGTVRLWDIRTQKPLNTLTQHSKSIRTMAVHPNENTFVTTDSGGASKQWLLPKGQLLAEFASPEQAIANTSAVNPATNEYFVGYDNGMVEVYDYVGGNLLQSGVVGDEGIYTGAFDMSGLRLLTAGGDKGIRVWGPEKTQ